MQHLPTNTLLQGSKYKIERVLGQGGFGITYLAVQTMLGRVVCIKEFFLKDFCTRTASGEVINGMAASSEFVERYRNKFIKEARIISKFDHPNIVHVLDTFTENGTAYYVMEYIEGASLDEIIRRDGAMPEDKAIGYIKQVARALDYIHQHSVNHLDVKPANIMVSRSDNRAILIDFGVSKQYDEQGEQTSSTPIGISHGYAPIEQYRAGGVSIFSPQSDIYALGATLYKLITGNTPPQPSDIINDGLPQLPNNVSAELKNLICYAMQIRKGDRPDSVDCFMAVSSQITNGAEDTIQVERQEVSYSDAIQIYKEAQSLSKQGDTRAQELYRKAFGMFLAVSLEGNADAQFYLAYCYSNGLGVEVDNDKAIEWYRRSAEQGNSSSQNNLGVCYSNGRGVNQDKAKAAEWYRKAAEQGEAYAQCNLADFYKDGIGVEKDLALAVLWYKKSADQQHERAMLALADCYYYGKGIEENKEEAIYIYKTLVGKGNEKAIETIKRIEEEENHDRWEKSWKGRIYHFLEKPLNWLPKPKVLSWGMLVWVAYLLLREFGIIKDFLGLSLGTEIMILLIYCIAALIYNYLKTVQEIFKYNNNDFLRNVFLSFFYLISIIGLIVISLSLSDVSSQSIPIDEESTNVSQQHTNSVEEEPAAPTTTPLYVTTTPSGAEVYIDGKKVGTTPIKDKEISRGSHKVKLSKDGYEDKMLTRTFGDKPVVINETLAETPKPQPQVQPQQPSAPVASSSSSAPATAGKINDHEYVDLGLSVKWATCNVGASSPSDYGNYYAWGETNAKNEYTVSNSNTHGKSIENIAGSISYDVARANWNGTWRLPTKAEFQELIDKCTWTWITQGGHVGYKVAGKNGKSIFLPAAGWRYGTTLNHVGERCYYWSATPVESDQQSAYSLSFYSGCRRVHWYYRNLGHSVRPVTE